MGGYIKPPAPPGYNTCYDMITCYDNIHVATVPLATNRSSLIPRLSAKKKNMNQWRTLAVFLFLYYHHLLSGVVSEFTPVVTAPVVYTTSSSQCDQYDPLQDEQLMEDLQQAKEQLPKQPSLMVNNSSCKSIHDSNPSAPSGFYQINSTNGSLVQVYCDMEGAICGGEGGWTRVAFVNMTKPGATCPQGLDQAMFDGSLYCGRFASSSAGCVSAVVDNIISYQKVYGRVLGYQQHAPDAFRPYSKFNANISGVYFDGLAIMSILVGIYGHMS